ncbi:hypothetical protein QR680_001015 [Steinernema hermaphroditum]|uniref:Uncharacterized protein n=1 Tax=Steinernema hermaphroditum TaxID=289476 RepID=A0AA39GWP1_9BILA|nr:hypothetical protein QR680_001015 [Steinernema hermaphroditum]
MVHLWSCDDIPDYQLHVKSIVGVVNQIRSVNIGLDIKHCFGQAIHRAYNYNVNCLALHMAEREIDQEYLARLERKLKLLKNPNKEFQSKDVFKEITQSREDRLFNLLTATSTVSSGFDDNFVDAPIKAPYLQRKIAPQTVAISKEEKLKLVKNDQLEKALLKLCSIEDRTGAADTKEEKSGEKPVPAEEEVKSELPVPIQTLNFSEPVTTNSQCSDVVFCVNHSGFLIFPNDDGAPCQLADLLEPSFLAGCHSLDLVTADTAPHRHNDCQAFIATCWVGFDEQLDHVKYIAAIFILDSDFNIRLGCNFTISGCPAYCRMTKPSPLTRNMHSWLVFSSDKHIDCYLVSPDDGKAKLVEEVFDVYPGLDLGDLAGAATRTACIYNSEFRWSAVAFDTGHVNVTVSRNDNVGFIVDRKSVKYNNVISFLHFLNKGLPSTETYLLVSSTSGPPVMWHLSLIDDQIRWRFKTALEDWRPGSDAVLCGAVNNNSVCIGTFGNVMLAYDLDEVLTKSVVPVNRSESITVSSPVLSIQFLSDGHMALLSNAGYHCFAHVKK